MVWLAQRLSGLPKWSKFPCESRWGERIVVVLHSTPNNLLCGKHQRFCTRTGMIWLHTSINQLWQSLLLSGKTQREQWGMFSQILYKLFLLPLPVSFVLLLCDRMNNTEWRRLIFSLYWHSIHKCVGTISRLNQGVTKSPSSNFSKPLMSIEAEMVQVVLLLHIWSRLVSVH